MIDLHLERAHQLIQLDRHAEAETEIRKALAGDPQNAQALALLSICRLEARAFAEAEDLARQAVAQQPDFPFYYLILGQAHFYNKNIPKARLAISEGQRLDPGNAAFFHLRAQIEFYQENWEQTLRETERGLELDPEDVDLVNLRARALVKLNRQDDASATLDYALHKAPENSYSHANKGWVAIEKDSYEQAVKHFLEALRLDPENDYARNGLKEAIKGKNLLYRGILKYFLWMNKLQEQGRWAFIIGAYIVYRFVLKAAENIPELAPLLYPIVAFYILFAFSSWIAKPISNLVLRLHPIGKHALDADEKLGSNIAGSLLLLVLLAFLGYYFTGMEMAFRVGMAAALLLIPVGGVFSVPEDTNSRRQLAWYATALGAAGAWWIVTGAPWAMLLLALGVFVNSFVANYFIGKEAKSFK